VSGRVQARKDSLVADLTQTRRRILDAASSLSPAQQKQVFLGSWSVMDLLAHLAGWDLANAEAIQAILSGKLPAFYEHFDRDWHGYNARLVAEHGRDSFAELIDLVRESHQRLMGVLEALPAEELDRDRGLRFKGYKVTIGRLLQAEADDEKTHHEQIERFRRDGSARSRGKGSEMVERILTKHPQEGKSGVNIERRKYETIREAMLESIRGQGEITFKTLTAAVRDRLEGRFEGSISWYVTTVKLDLEARGIIERIPKRTPQHLRIVED